jgi:non-heme Fe2+,alpha-ketoglutarate-dependent halogenase
LPEAAEGFAMNMNPKLRPLWIRLLLTVAASGALVYKALHLPTSILPRDLQSVITNWEYETFWMVIKSRFTKAYIDQPCYFQMPQVIESKADVAPEFQLSPEELNRFYKDGYLGPFDAFSADEMKQFKAELDVNENTVSETYGFVTPRDRHFEMPSMWRHFQSPAITERIAQILGPDLLVWRTQNFYKRKGAPTIQWHQASTFLCEDYQDPALYPQDRSEIFQITVWIAVDDATPANGCMRFAPGTHNSIKAANFGGDERFFNTMYTLDFDHDAQPLVEVPVKSGQFILFTERCVHGSGPNFAGDRLSFNMRVIPTDVAVYTDKKYYRSVYQGGKYHLDKWGVAVLRGEDRHQLSRTVSQQELERVGHAGRRAA